MTHHYTYIWQFNVAEHQVSTFEQLYGDSGEWVRLFKRAEGYLGTTLLQDRVHPRRYVTIDRWLSYEAYLAFRKNFESDYQRLDGLGEGMTTTETLIGEFNALTSS